MSEYFVWIGHTMYNIQPFMIFSHYSKLLYTSMVCEIELKRIFVCPRTEEDISLYSGFFFIQIWLLDVVNNYNIYIPYFKTANSGCEKNSDGRDKLEKWITLLRTEPWTANVNFTRKFIMKHVSALFFCFAGSFAVSRSIMINIRLQIMTIQQGMSTWNSDQIHRYIRKMQFL